MLEFPLRKLSIPCPPVVQGQFKAIMAYIMTCSLNNVCSWLGGMDAYVSNVEMENVIVSLRTLVIVRPIAENLNLGDASLGSSLQFRCLLLG